MGKMNDSLYTRVVLLFPSSFPRLFFCPSSCLQEVAAVQPLHAPVWVLLLLSSLVLSVFRD